MGCSIALKMLLLYVFNDDAIEKHDSLACPHLGRVPKKLRFEFKSSVTKTACCAGGTAIESRFYHRDRCGMMQWSAIKPHKLEVAGSNPAPATIARRRICKPY